MICFINQEPCKYIHCGMWSERLQACRLVLAVDKLLGDDGKRPIRFTPREQGVLNLIVQGYSNQQISEALSIGHSTTKNHVSKILQKLGAKSRTEAVVMSFNQG